MKFNERYALHPEDFLVYDTDRINGEILAEQIFLKDELMLMKNLQMNRTFQTILQA